VNRKLLLALCVMIVIGYLIVGLWPFQLSPPNRVSWLPDGPGIDMGQPSVLYSDKPLDLRNSDGGVSVELCLQPGSEPGWGIIGILSLYDESLPWNLFVAQRKTDLWLWMPAVDKRGRRTHPGMQAKADLRPGVRRCVAVTSGGNGTNLYVDGVLARSYTQVRLRPNTLRGYLVLGGVTFGGPNWEGRIYGAAIFSRILTASDIARHCRLWSGDNRFEMMSEAGLAALYFFDEGSGASVRDYGPARAPLEIGRRYELMSRRAFEAPWKGPYSRSDIATNLLGFVPFGFCYFLYRRRTYPGCVWRNVVLTLAAATFISTAIELIQVWLPARSPSYLDILCNISGAAAGLLLTLTYADKTPTHAEKI